MVYSLDARTSVDPRGWRTCSPFVPYGWACGAWDLADSDRKTESRRAETGSERQHCIFEDYLETPQQNIHFSVRLTHLYLAKHTQDTSIQGELVWTSTWDLNLGMS